jgi:hypothetical protein
MLAPTIGESARASQRFAAEPNAKAWLRNCARNDY